MRKGNGPVSHQKLSEPLTASWIQKCVIVTIIFNCGILFCSLLPANALSDIAADGQF